MLLGIWNNISDLEEKLNLSELYAILDASRKQRYEHHRFMAALKGIDLDENAKNEAKEKFDEIQDRVNRKLYGEGAVEADSMDFFGLDIEYEE